MPYFSIVIPLYNKANEVSKTLESVLAQTIADFEIIIINDGSTDKSLAKVEAFEDKRIQIFTTENKGVSHARNFGIKKATADLIAFLDADDLWFDHHLADLKALHEQFPECGMYCKAYNKLSGNTLIISNFKDIPKSENWKGIVDNYFHHSLINSIAFTSAVSIKKNALKSVGSFNEDLNSGEDTELWIKIALVSKIAFDNKTSVIHNLNATQQLTKSKLSNRNHLNFKQFENEEKMNRSLKMYLDRNRYALAIQYKLQDEPILSQNIFEQIDIKNLTTIQKWIYSKPKIVINTLLSSRNFLRMYNFNLKLFK